ncbi:hypothetical protein ALC56_01742, partial [Trachymyrmex septentrionalis]
LFLKDKLYNTLRIKQRPGEGLHSRWGKKSRRRKKEKERERKRDVQDEDNEGKEMVERMVRTVIRGRLRKGARTSDRTGHRRSSVHSPVEAFAITHTTSTAFTLNSHLVNAYAAHGSSPFVSNWLENYLRNKKHNEKWNYLVMFVERVLISVTWRLQQSSRDNICLIRKFCNLYLRNNNPQTRNSHWSPILLEKRKWVLLASSTKGTVIMTEIAEGQEVLRSTIVDPQSTSGFLFQHASNFHLKWLAESNANDAVIYEKQITLVMQIKQTVCVFNLSHARRTKRNESMKTFQ